MLPINDKEVIALGEANGLNPSMQWFKRLEFIASALQGQVLC